jgi:F-type H+-transporting ATPase subunit delta
MTKVTLRLTETYSQALFGLASEAGLIDAVQDDLLPVLIMLDREPDFDRVLLSPYCAAPEKLALIRKVLSDRVTDLTMEFLGVVVKRGRTRLLRSIVRRYGQLWDQHHGLTDVGITLAEPADDGEAARLAQDVAAAIGGPVRLKVDVDPTILGGAIIRYDGNRVDNTLKGRLDRAVKQTLTRAKSRSYEI